MRYAQIVGGEIVNVILWNGEERLEAEGGLARLADGAPLGIGWSRVDGVWVPPPVREAEVEEDPDPEPPLDPSEWLIEEDS